MVDIPKVLLDAPFHESELTSLTAQAANLSHAREPRLHVMPKRVTGDERADSMEDLVREWKDRRWNADDEKNIHARMYPQIIGNSNLFKTIGQYYGLMPTLTLPFVCMAV